MTEDLVTFTVSQLPGLLVTAEDIGLLEIAGQNPRSKHGGNRFDTKPFVDFKKKQIFLVIEPGIIHSSDLGFEKTLEESPREHL